MIAGIDKIIVERHKRQPPEMTTDAGVIVPMKDTLPCTGEIVALPVSTTHEVDLRLGDTVRFAQNDGMALDLNRLVLHLTQILEVIR